MIFNIYYINFSKVYEIKMMLGNVIALSREEQTDQSKGKEIDYRGKLGANFLTVFNTGIEAKMEGKISNRTLKKYLK